MSSDAFAQDWPGRGARGRKARHREAWAFAKKHGGHRHRPTPEEVEDFIAMRRMRGGPWGGGPFGGPPWGVRRSGGGRARRGDVRLALLRLLAEEPRNGYQLMQTIEERSAGAWRPSPGSVYPTLSQLEDEGLVRSVEADGTRTFEITDAGREHLETRADEPAPWDLPDAEGRPGHDAKRLIGAIAQAAMQVAMVGTEDQRNRAVELLNETRKGLYRILAEDQDEE
jgi:DNA-binding PadR family transcriptional regulator